LIEIGNKKPFNLPIVKGGLIEVWDKPGLGIEFDTKAAKQYLAAEDKNFFD
jgi:L-alanine-DL-glutamate epimerase-like enolase superfamily enzyme